MRRTTDSARIALSATAAAASLLLFSFALEGDASAFCRSTTCRTTATKECETDENSCPTTGSKLFWPTSCVSYATNKLGTQDLDPVDTRAIIKKTFQAWSDVPCPAGGTASMTFQEREPVNCHKNEYNKNGPNVNVVLFQDDDWKYRGIDGTLAKTSVTYNDDTGEIYDADIEVNTANNTVTITDDPRKIQYDLQAILTHEVGHFIGIAHSPLPDAVMYASYNPGSTSQRKLTDDDIQAICDVYPPHNGVACNTEPRGGFSGECSDPADSKKLCSVSAPGNADAPGGMLGFVFGTGFLTAARFGRRRASRNGGWRK